MNMLKVTPSVASIWRCKLPSELVVDVENLDGALDGLASHEDWVYQLGLSLKISFQEGVSQSHTRENRVKIIHGVSSRECGANSFRFHSSLEPPQWFEVTQLARNAQCRERAVLKIHEGLIPKQSTMRVVASIKAVKKSRAINSHSSSFSVTCPTYIELGSMPVFLEGESPPIRVLEHSLSIESRILSDPNFIRRDVGALFEWYSQCGGEYAGIDVTIHLRDGNGKLSCLTFPVQLKTELIYDDGSVAPLEVQSNNWDSRRNKGKPTSLFRNLRASPILKGTSSCDFSFRIEEVSQKHSGRGFKLKVSVADAPLTASVLPGITEETILVKSKPYTKQRGSRDLNGGQKSPLSGGVLNRVPARGGTAFCCRDKLSLSFQDMHGACLWCQNVFDRIDIFWYANHQTTCYFVREVLPHISVRGTNTQKNVHQDVTSDSRSITDGYNDRNAFGLGGNIISQLESERDGLRLLSRCALKALTKHPK